MHSCIAMTTATYLKYHHSVIYNDTSAAQFALNNATTKLKPVVVTRLTSITLFLKVLRFTLLPSITPCENATNTPHILERSSNEATFCLQYILTVCTHFLMSILHYFFYFLKYFYSFCSTYINTKEFGIKNICTITVPILPRKLEACGIKMLLCHTGTLMEHL